MEYIKSYNIIKEFYGNKCANRSKVPLINHINEGIAILKYLKASDDTISAYCLHPILQSDNDLKANINIDFESYQISHKVIILVMEYRKAANSYLSKNNVEECDTIVLNEVKQMLIADKIQNYKDFMTYHYSTHERSDNLYIYFHNWFEILGIKIEEYLNQHHLYCFGNNGALLCNKCGYYHHLVDNDAGSDRELLKLCIKCYNMSNETKIEILKTHFVGMEQAEFDAMLSQCKLSNDNMIIDTRLNDESNFIDFETFLTYKNDIEICKVLHARRIPKKDKLLHLVILTGEGLRNVVTNIGDKFEPETLISNNYPFRLNVKPSKIGGIVSEAIISCATYNDEIVLINSNQYFVGTKIS